MTRTGPFRAALLGAFIGGLGPLLLIIAAFFGYLLLYLDPGLAGNEDQASFGLVVAVVLALAELTGLWWLCMRILRGAGSPSPRLAATAGLAVPIASAILVAYPASAFWEFGVTVALSGAVTGGFSAAAGGWRGSLMSVLLGVVPAAVLIAINGWVPFGGP